MGSAGKTQIVVNTSSVGQGDSIASYLADGSGNFLTSQVISAVRRLDANIASDRAENTAHTLGDEMISVLAVRRDAMSTIASADGNYGALQMDSSGRLRVIADFNSTSNPDYAEDSVAADGATGTFVLGVRRDAWGSQATASGDYSELQTWSNGDLKTADILNNINLQQVVVVGTTAAQLPAVSLASRKMLFVQMLSDGQLYLGSSTVTSSGATRGLLIGKGGYVNLEAGPANAVFGIANAAAKDVVVWEHS